MYYYTPIALLNGICKNTVDSGRQGSIAVREDVDVAALGPADVRWGMNRFFDIGTVEVKREGLSLWERAWEAEDVP